MENGADRFLQSHTYNLFNGSYNGRQRRRRQPVKSDGSDELYRGSTTEPAAMNSVSDAKGSTNATPVIVRQTNQLAFHLSSSSSSAEPGRSAFCSREHHRSINPAFRSALKRYRCSFFFLTSSFSARTNQCIVHLFSAIWWRAGDKW